MRITVPARVTLEAASAHTLTLTGAHRERFQISVLDHDLIRFSHHPNGEPRLDRTWLIVGADGDVPREGRRRDDLAPFALPAFDTTVGPDEIMLTTAQLSVTIDLADLYLRWADREGRIFASDLPGRAYPYDRAGRAIYHYLVRARGDRYFGFGERSGPLNKAGRRMRLVNVDAMGYDAQHSDPLYKHIPFYITFNPALGIAYGLFYDNLATTIFDMGQEIDAFWGDYRYYQADDGDLDYYLIYGPTIPAVVERYTALTGRPALLPRWALGYLGSTMQYTEAPDAQTQLARFVDLCGEHDIPCDMFHLSSGYTADPTGKRYVFTWNRDRIPDPDAMVARFHGGGIRVAPNIKPYLLTTHPEYDEVARSGGFIKAAGEAANEDADADRPALSRFWSGGRGESAEGAHLDFTSEAGFAWWGERIADALLHYNVDGIWNDNNEFQLWDDAARCDGFGAPLPIGLARPLQTLLMARASTEALHRHRPDLRPFVLSRAGAPGIQRYAQTWSGDNTTSWETLRYNIPMGLGLSLSGVPNTGHDVGGFAGPPPDPELLVRWVQHGIFNPRFAIHSWNDDGSVTEPWMYPAMLPHIRAAINFRYRLLPYFYALMFEAAQTGHPIIRPPVYEFPDDPNLDQFDADFTFLLGPSLLIATVLEPDAEARRVYLPANTRWCDFRDGTWYDGGQTIAERAGIADMPLLVRAGGIIPLGKPMRHVGEQPDDLREAYIYPPPEGGEGHFTLIEDDGRSLSYQRGSVTRVPLSFTATAEQITVSIDPPAGDFTLPYAAIEFVLPPGDTRPVQGAALRIGDDGRRRARLPIPD
ncbi:MAG: glycoside hydrolase family 31 protein [Chloroflexi bacterium]|nr:glycoside hydrolase family 31 protein [Chloroflexota bacterium]